MVEFRHFRHYLQLPAFLVVASELSRTIEPCLSEPAVRFGAEQAESEATST